MSSFLTLLTLSLSTAHAEEPLALLKQSLESTESTPFAVMSCGEIGTLQRGFQASPLVNLAAVSMEAKIPNTPSGLQAKEWIRLIRSGGLASTGLDESGSVLFEVWSSDGGEKFRGTVPMTGTPEQVQLLMERIFQDALVTHESGGWQVNQKDPQEVPWQAELVPNEEGQRLLFTKGTPKMEVRAPDSILNGLPSHSGCYLYVYSDDPNPIGLSSIVLAITNNPEMPLLFRMQSNLEFPESLNTPQNVVMEGSSTDVPIGVLSMSISPYGLLDFPMIQNKMKPEQKEQVEKLREVLQLPPGLSLALFGTRKQPEPVLVLPILNARGKAFRTRQLNRLLSRALPDSMEYERTARDAFSLVFEDKPVYGRIQSGRVVMGSDAGRVDEAAFGLGTPWLTDADQEWRSNWPLTVKFQTSDEIPFIPSKIGGIAGIRVHENTMEFAIQTDQELGAIAPAALGIAVGVGIPNFITMQYRSKRSEVPTNLEQIRTAMLAAQTQGHPLEALPAAPRPVESLDKNKIPWSTSPEWDSIGWKPDESVRGAYWAILLPNGGFEIHGQSDVDGDGVPAHYVLSNQDSDARMLTESDVY